MNKIMLINRINPNDNSKEKKKIFFALSGMDKVEVENKIMDALHKGGFLEEDNLVLKYNGIQLKITSQQIPEVVKLLVKEDVGIYNIYELYNPKL